MVAQSGTIAVVDAKGSADPVVTSLSGISMTAKKGATDSAIDIMINSGSLSFMIVSYSPFYITVN